MRYSLPFVDLATGAVADTYTTLAAILAADTLGQRARILSICVGPADNEPVDANVSIKLARIAEASGGTAGTATTIAAANVPKADPYALECPLTCKTTYTVEPTAYGAQPIFAMDFNARGGLLKEWSRDDAPVVGRDTLVGLLAAPRAAAAVRLSGTIEFEMF